MTEVLDNVDMDDLDAFDAAMRSPSGGKEPVVAEEPVEDEVDNLDDNPVAPENDEDQAESEPEDTPEEEEEPEGKKRKPNRLQERINELTADKHEERRLRMQLEARLAELEAASKSEEPKGIREQLPVDAPNPDAKNEDGSPVYPLGEFDGTYLADLTKFMVDKELKAASERQALEAQQKDFEKSQQALADSWADKVAEAEKVNPEIRDNLKNLTDTFEHIPTEYGEYLAMTLMECDNGVEIMDYLSQNIGEAQRIVASGAAAATRAIGRLEARFARQTEEAPRNKKVTEASAPPEDRSRGTKGRFSVAPDTDDLDAFERVFFDKKK